jgi:hypothetical protein
MNERIKELAMQAGAQGIVNRDFIDVEKFAELIIRECISKIETYDLTPGHSAKWKDIYDIHARLLQNLGEELKEHFGIES